MMEKVSDSDPEERRVKMLSTCESNELPEEYFPTENDVICGWARQNYHHEGNRRLREIINENVPNYLAASTKTEKGQVIVEIVEKIRRCSPSGVGMVRLNTKTGRWFFIGNDKAKDKVGHALRKASQQEIQKRRSEADASSGKRKRKETTQEGRSEKHAPRPSPLTFRCREEAELYSNYDHHRSYGNENTAYNNYSNHHAPPNHHYGEYKHPPSSSAAYTYGSYHCYPPPPRVNPYHSHSWDHGMPSQYHEPSNGPPQHLLYSGPMS